MGGKNSSNSSHLVELCEQKLPTYFIDDVNKIINENEIIKTNWKDKSEEIIQDFLPAQATVSILMTSGASCPDTVVESVIRKVASFYNVEAALDDVIQFWQAPN